MSQSGSRAMSFHVALSAQCASSNGFNSATHALSISSWKARVGLTSSISPPQPLPDLVDDPERLPRRARLLVDHPRDELRRDPPARPTRRIGGGPWPDGARRRPRPRLRLWLWLWRRRAAAECDPGY